MNRDGVISWTDVVAVQRCVGLWGEDTCTLADFDGNGFVTWSDLIGTSEALGKSCTL